MNIRKIIAAVSAAAFIALSFTYEADAKAQKDKRTKKELQAENASLMAELDSLKQEIEKYRAELYRTDSLTNEILDYYEVSQEGDSLTIENYTAEVSDSLLNIWYAHKMANVESEIFDMDSVKFQSNVPDSVYIKNDDPGAVVVKDVA